MLDAVFQRLSQKYQPSSIKVYRNTLIKIFREAYQTSDQDLQMFQNFERFRKYLTTVPNHLRRSQVFTVILVLKGAHLLELATPYEKLYDQLTQESVGQNTQSNQIIYNIQNMRGKSSVVLDTLRRKVSQLHDRARKFHHDTKDQRNYLIGLLYTFLPLRADELVQLRIGYVDTWERSGDADSRSDLSTGENCFTFKPYSNFISTISSTPNGRSSQRNFRLFHC